MDPRAPIVHVPFRPARQGGIVPPRAQKRAERSRGAPYTGRVPLPLRIRLRLALAAGILAGLAVGAPTVAAITIDGVLDPEYGVARSTQTTQTAFGDTDPAQSLSSGSELDAAYAVVEAGVLHLFVAGNFRFFQSEPLILPHQLEIWFDTGPGGQNVLRADNPHLGSDLQLDEMAGLAFDAGFAPDHWFQCVTLAAGRLQAYTSTLPADAGGSGAPLGRSSAGTGGVLANGTNPHDVRATVGTLQAGGVDAGCGAASGGAMTQGIEWAIPLAALGHPSGTIKIAMFVDRYIAPQVSNQSLGPMPPGTCALGDPASVDFAALAGDQYFVIDVPVPVVRTTWGAVKRAYTK